MAPCADRAVSEVVGMVLILAIVALLATVVGAMALSFGAPPEPAPMERFTLDTHMDGEGNTNHRPYIEITHEGSEPVDGSHVYIEDTDGNRIAWEDVWTGGPTVEPGEYVHIDGYQSDAVLNHVCEGETFYVIYDPPDRDPVILNQVDIDRPATGPAASHC